MRSEPGIRLWPLAAHAAKDGLSSDNENCGLRYGRPCEIGGPELSVARGSNLAGGTIPIPRPQKSRPDEKPSDLGDKPLRSLSWPQ